MNASRSELKAEQDKLWKMAANTFSLLGEARVTERGMELAFFGDVPPWNKLGLSPDTDFSSLESVLKIMHPDDVEPYRLCVENSVETGAPFQVVYRLSDGRGGWRWMKARACSLEERDGKHVRFLHDTIDITEQKHVEEALRKTVAELEQLKAQLQKENLFLREEINRDAADVEIIGRSAPLARVLEQVALVAATTSTVLISGETGTGKELVARAIHQGGNRRKQLFVAVNCAAMPATLVESELFGHEKGAFTGAVARRAGRFEQADGGTLFLDEVGELPLETQAKMLRVLQSGEFERVGGGPPLKVSVRIIAASNSDLEQAMRDGRFRRDLYHRLAVFPIHLPPLRERPEDIPLLAAYLVTRKARQLKRRIEQIPDNVLARLTAYDWPGNVRELDNVLERALILSPGTTLTLEAIHLRPVSPGQTPRRPLRHEAAPEAGAGDTLQACERAHILSVCTSTSWKIKGPGGAAKILGLNPGTLYSRMKKLSVRRP
ncbi:MAG: sigma 54-interacting transcriptional regulator [bacterium]